MQKSTVDFFFFCCLHAQSLHLCPTQCNPVDCSLPCSSVHGISPSKNTRVDCHFLLQGIFLTQISNPGLPHCKRILYHLRHQGSPIFTQSVANVTHKIILPFSSPQLVLQLINNFHSFLLYFLGLSLSAKHFQVGAAHFESIFAQ